MDIILIKFKLLVVAISLLVGCSTPYQDRGFSGGYSETQLDENIFIVSFGGNKFTEMERATDFTLLRSAELAIKSGFNYFVVVGSNKYTTESSYTTPTIATTNANSNTYVTANAYGNNIYGTVNTNGTATTTMSGGNTYYASEPSSSNKIVCFKERPKDIFSYDAEFIFKSITQKYDI